MSVYIMQVLTSWIAAQPFQQASRTCAASRHNSPWSLIKHTQDQQNACFQMSLLLYSLTGCTTYFGTTTSMVIRYSESSTKSSFFTISARLLVNRLPLKIRSNQINANKTSWSGRFCTWGASLTHSSSPGSVSFPSGCCKRTLEL